MFYWCLLSHRLFSTITAIPFKNMILIRRNLRRRPHITVSSLRASTSEGRPKLVLSLSKKVQVLFVVSYLEVLGILVASGVLLLIAGRRKRVGLVTKASNYGGIKWLEVLHNNIFPFYCNKTNFVIKQALVLIKSSTCQSSTEPPQKMYQSDNVVLLVQLHCCPLLVCSMRSGRKWPL